VEAGKNLSFCFFLPNFVGLGSSFILLFTPERVVEENCEVLPCLTKRVGQQASQGIHFSIRTSLHLGLLYSIQHDIAPYHSSVPPMHWLTHQHSLEIPQSMVLYCVARQMLMHPHDFFLKLLYFHCHVVKNV